MDPVTTLMPGLAGYAVTAVAMALIVSGAVAQIAALFGLGRVAQISTIIHDGLQKIAGNYGLAANANQPPAPSGRPGAGLGLVVLLALGCGGVGLVSACTATGQLTPQAQAALSVACRVDQQVQPIVVALTPAIMPELEPLVSADQALVHPVVLAACAAVGGQPVTVTVAPRAG